MDKNSIYRIIGYQGEYTENVKKALKKLLKDNHPDRKGNREIFQLVNEVKNELENNAVSFKSSAKNKITSYNDINIDYCQKMIDKFQKDKLSLEQEIASLSGDIAKYLDDYHKLYRDNMQILHNILRENNQKLKTMKYVSIILLFIVVILFVMAIVFQKISLFLLFGISCILAIIVIEKNITLLSDIKKKSQKVVKKYVKKIRQLQDNTQKRKILEEERLILKRKLENVENNLRFYHNLLK